MTRAIAPGSFEDLLYVRGFTLTPEPGVGPREGWATQALHGWTLAHDACLGFATASEGGASVSVLGTIIDTDTWSSSDAAVERAVSALALAEDEFLDVVDAWAGRHLIVWARGGSVSAMTDAAGMRTCFYNLEGELRLASHAALAAEITDALPADVAFTQRPRFSRGSSYFPGRTTPWEGVVFLTANTALDLDSGELRRVWPRRPLPQRSIEDAAELLAQRLPNQMRWLSDSGQEIVVSLTGGIDSRVTLAASRSVVEELSFFAYRTPGNEVHENDVRIASEIARTLGLRHRELVAPPDLGPDSAAAKRALEANSFLSHLRSVAEMYRRTFSPDAIHVRSNVAEIGRRFYDKAGQGVQIETARHMARVWKRMPHVPEVVAAFREWAHAVGFWDVSDVDPVDLFYWEHRMPCWHGPVVLESDIAFESHALFNCRAVLENLLSVPVEARRQSLLFAAFTERAWPEVAAFPLA